MHLVLAPIVVLLLTQTVPPLASEFGRIAQGATGRVGVAVAILEDSKMEPVGWQNGYSFPMQSVYKLPIAMTVLRMVDRDVLSLDHPVRIAKAEVVPEPAHSPLRERYRNGLTVPLGEIVRLAVAESDGTASDVLLRLAGGPSKVMDYLKEIDVRGLVVEDSEMRLARQRDLQYRNAATPDAALALLRALHSGPALSAKSRALLLQSMIETKTGANRIKGQLPSGTVVAHKTGTSTTVRGVTAATNDIGIVRLPDGRHLAIAVFVADAKMDLAAREAIIARIARAAWDHYSPR
jgi:beta-lactamase class A